MDIQTLAIVITVFISTLGLAKLAAKWGTSKIDAELKELKSEEFTLRKQMLHDKHRLAYITARHKMLVTAPAEPEPVPRHYDELPGGMAARTS